jgi:hypothetical protein
LGNWKCPIEYQTSYGNVKAEDLKIHTLKLIDFLKDCGFNVRAIASDQGTPNQKLFKILNITKNKPYFYHSKISEICIAICRY